MKSRHYIQFGLLALTIVVVMVFLLQKSKSQPKSKLAEFKVEKIKTTDSVIVKESVADRYTILNEEVTNEFYGQRISACIPWGKMDVLPVLLLAITEV